MFGLLANTYFLVIKCTIYELMHFRDYCIVGKFGGGKVWRIDSFQAFGERKFGKIIDQPIGY